MASTFNDSVQLNAPKPLDNKQGIFSGGVFRPYVSKTEVLSTIPHSRRYVTLTVPISISGVPIDHWFRDAIETEDDLVIKNPTQSSASGIVEFSAFTSSTTTTTTTVAEP